MNSTKILNATKKATVTIATEVKKGVKKTQDYISKELKIVELESERDSLFKDLGEKAHKEGIIDNVLTTKIDNVINELKNLQKDKK